MHWWPKDAPVYVYHEPLRSKEFREDLVKIRRLPDVPQRLSMVERYDTVELWGATVPGQAVGKIGADERGNIADSLANNTQRKHVSNDHITFGMELAPIAFLNPATNWKVRFFWRGNLAADHHPESLQKLAQANNTTLKGSAMCQSATAAVTFVNAETVSYETELESPALTPLLSMEALAAVDVSLNVVPLAQAM